MAHALARGMGMSRPPEGLYYAQLPGALSEPPAQEIVARAAALVGAELIILDSLKRASKGEDPEVGHRAEELVARIERRIEAARLLEPKRVRLHLVDTPVPDAVAELKRQTGYPIQLGFDTARAARRALRP